MERFANDLLISKLCINFSFLASINKLKRLKTKSLNSRKVDRSGSHFGLFEFFCFRLKGDQVDACDLLIQRSN